MVALETRGSLRRAVDGPLAAVLQERSEYVVSFAGRSQYGGVGGVGTSACGLAALNCARVILGRERDGLKDVKLLREMMRRETLEDVLRICLRWSSTAHLDVDEIAKAPIFAKTLTPLWSQYAQPEKKQFQNLISRLQESATGSAAVVVTRPPEIVCLLKIVTDTRDVFVLFDSHPRHNHPDGGAFIFHPSADAAAEYLSELFKYDPHLLADTTLQWQAQLLANFCGHAFTLKNSLTNGPALLDTVLDSSLEILALKAEASELKRTNDMLQSQMDHLISENTRLEDEVDRLRHTSRQAAQSSSSGSLRPTAPWSSSPTASLPRAKPVSSSSKRTNSMSKPLLPTPTASASNVRPSPKGKMVMRTVDEADDDDLFFATRIQLEWEEDQEDKEVLSRRLAVQQQQEFDREDRHLRAQMTDLQKSAPRMFTCGICLEELSEFMIARTVSCGHELCRDCTRGHIRAKLGEHRFPILCPICAADRDKTDPGAFSTVLVQQIGLTEEEFALFTELELSSFSVLLHCRKCQQAMFVDKEEYEAQDLIVCPLPGCNYVWCKNCSRAIEVGGPQHSCDGSNELNHLMSQRGWKHCPGCRTPTEKIDGCNHMTCPSPGCNTHFCYVCGLTIVQSVLRREIQRALTSHYSRCRLIEVD